MKMKLLLSTLTILLLPLCGFSSIPQTKQEVIKSKVKEAFQSILAKTSSADAKVDITNIIIEDALEQDNALYIAISTITHLVLRGYDGSLEHGQSSSLQQYYIVKLKIILDDYTVQEIRIRDKKGDRNRPLDYLELYFDERVAKEALMGTKIYP